MSSKIINGFPTIPVIAGIVVVISAFNAPAGPRGSRQQQERRMAKGSILHSRPHKLDSKLSNFDASMMHAMSLMDRKMARAPMVGDPDRDFAAMMIPHHEGAIDMARMELLHGRDRVLRRLAEEIVVTQQEEIRVMQLRIRELSSVKDPRRHIR